MKKFANRCDVGPLSKGQLTQEKTPTRYNYSLTISQCKISHDSANLTSAVFKVICTAQKEPPFIYWPNSFFLV